MERKNAIGKVLAGLVLSVIFLVPSVQAFARERNDRGGRDERGHQRSREVVIVDHQRYNYHDGRFYRPGWFGFEFFVSSPPRGAIVASIPIGHRSVIVGGVNYYTYDNVYYTECPSGYIVVPQPVVPPTTVVVSPVQPPPVYSPEMVTINVPNTNGSYTPITLIRKGTGYVGPQGEYYPDHPTVEQLRVLYGK